MPTTRVASLLAPRHIRIHETELPQLQPGEVAVRIRVALTDGTDLKTYRRGHPKMPFPTRFGHEFSGDIVAIGAGVQRFAPGDAVMSVHTAPCGCCFWCLREEEELCPAVVERMLLGAYADHLILPAPIVARQLYLKPATLSYESAAFLEPLACVAHVWERIAREQPRLLRSDTQLVLLGVGGFALLHAMFAQAYGITRRCFVGRGGERAALAQRLVLGEVIDTRHEDAEAVVRAWSGDRGADIVIEATGDPVMWESAPSFARRGGRVVLFGGLPAGTRVGFDATRLHYDAIRLESPFHLTPRSVRTAWRLLADARLDPTPLITSRRPLAEIVDVFAELDAGRGVKVAILP